jgi:hypothetical protein
LGQIQRIEQTSVRATEKFEIIISQLNTAIQKMSGERLFDLKNRFWKYYGYPLVFTEAKVGKLYKQFVEILFNNAQHFEELVAVVSVQQPYQHTESDLKRTILQALCSLRWLDSFLSQLKWKQQQNDDRMKSTEKALQILFDNLDNLRLVCSNLFI